MSTSRRWCMKVVSGAYGALIALLMVSCGVGGAEPNPALLRYEGDGGVVYLFPTIHSLPDDAASEIDGASDLLPQYVTEAISESDKVLTETDPLEALYAEEQEELDQLAFASDDEQRKSLFEYAREAWDDDEYSRLEALFEEFYDSPLVETQFERAKLEQLRPHAFFFDIATITGVLAVENDLSIDAGVTRVAHEESVDQVGLGDALLIRRLADEAPQLVYLDSLKEVALEEPTMEEIIDDQKESITRYFQTWKTGELPVVTAQEEGNDTDSASDEDVYELSISTVETLQQEERAEVWISTILDALEGDDVEQVFVAVGTNHLAEVQDDIEIEHIRSRLAAEFGEERVD